MRLTLNSILVRRLQVATRAAFLRIAHSGVSLLAAVQTDLTRALVRVPPLEEGRAIRRILIIKLDELGDLVMAWPLIDTLQSNFPAAELTLLVNRSVLGITEGMVGIRVIGVNVKCNRLLRPLILPIRHYRFVQDHLRNEDFDVCLLPRRDSDDVAATILGYFTRSTRRISFSEKSTPRKAVTNRSFDSLLTDALPAPETQHETITNLSLLAAIGCFPVAWKGSLPLPQAAIRYAQEALRESEAPFVAICPTSGHSPLKQWGVERFAELASRLVASGLTVVVVGGSGDLQLGATLQQACEGKCLNFTGKTSLAQMAALLDRCIAFVGNDAGPMHVASALGVGTVGVFGSSCWHQFGPWGPRHAVLVGEISCSPCHSHPKNRCDVCIHGKPICLEKILTSQVLETTLSVVAAAEERGLPGQ